MTDDSFRDEIFQILNNKIDLPGSTTNIILKLFEKRIDRLIERDDETINLKAGTKEGKVAAQISKNTLILIKEMLKC